MRIDFGCRWFDISFSSKRERTEDTESDEPRMFYSNTASSTEQTYHFTDAPSLGYRSKLGDRR